MSSAVPEGQATVLLTLDTGEPWHGRAPDRSSFPCPLSWKSVVEEKVQERADVFWA